MHKLLRKFYLLHKRFWTKERLFFLVQALVLFIIAFVIQRFADNYVSNLHDASVGDVLLSHLPTLDIDFLIIQSVLILTLVILLLLLFKPKYISFTIKALSVFVIVRSITISLTHLGADPRELTYDTHSIGYGIYNLLFNSKNDFFFSGHTGLPFLMSLIFWREKFWRYFFMTVSVVLAASVLLAHVHYTVDVFAAPFMTYSIFCIARYLFAKDYKVLDHKHVA